METERVREREREQERERGREIGRACMCVCVGVSLCGKRVRVHGISVFASSAEPLDCLLHNCGVPVAWAQCPITHL